jgi:hypothetical protein
LECYTIDQWNAQARKHPLAFGGCFVDTTYMGWRWLAIGLGGWLIGQPVFVILWWLFARWRRRRNPAWDQYPAPSAQAAPSDSGKTPLAPPPPPA